MSPYYYSEMYLQHHGILGQKWGVRRFQDKSGRLTSLGKRLKEAAGKQKAPSDEGKSKKPKSEWDHSESILSLRKVSETIKKFSDTRKIQQYSPGIALVKATKDIVDSVAPDVKVKTELMRTSKLQVDPKTNLPMKDKTWSNEDDIKAVNPGFQNFDENTKSNCVLCTCTYDLRQRGYDVQANKASYGYGLYSSMNHWYTGAECRYIQFGGGYGVMSSDSDVGTEADLMQQLQNPDQYADDVMNELIKNGGKRGNLCVCWAPPYGGGHSIVYENTPKGLRIVDCQTAEVYDTPQKCHELLKQTYACRYANLDKAEVNPDTIHEVTNEGN